MPVLARLLLCCVLVGNLSGCLRGPLAWQRLTLNEPISEHDVAFILDGTTTLTEVVDRLGAPDDIQSVGDSIIARYRFSDGKYFRADYGRGIRYGYFSSDV
jgi:hypothetical protein